SDILLYGAEYVPVGDDQSQHLEITRDLGQRINTKFLQDIFRLPKPVKDQHAFFGKDRGLRIMDLVDPTKKMSKSDENGKGVIFLGDSPELVSKKVMSATTDSIGVINYDKENQPGITNLLDLLALITQQDLKAIIDEYKGQTQYGQLKKTVAEAVRLFITDFQTKLASVDEQAIIDKLEVSEELMNKQANKTLQKVQKAIGLR
ncbi:MAG: tryptophanyl-tRNA synthetase, partial [Patescibacteria group bacterium]|nr:tryptophanyl-tRNA synthetase [Patescibacteria group bacterium]